MVTINELEDQIKSLKEQLESLETDEKVTIQQETESKKTGEYQTESKNKLIILPDTSWLVAILDEKDSHHTSAASSLGALIPYSPVFYVPLMVFMETMSRLIRVNKSVEKCSETILKLLNNKLHAKGSVVQLDFKDVIKRYKICSRQSIKRLTTIDFYIVTEGISMGAKILTCDLEMYKKSQKYYKEIYFMSDKVKTQKSDLARLITDIQLFIK